jgi:hypothetical protein
LDDHKLPQGPLGHGGRAIGPPFRYLRPLAQRRDFRSAVRGHIRGEDCRAEFR